MSYICDHGGAWWALSLYLQQLGDKTKPYM